MIFEIPYEFSISGRKKGNLRTATAKTYETVEIDVPVVDPDMAPVAVEWDHALPDDIRIDPGLWRGVPVDGTQHVRFFEGAYYERVELRLDNPPFDRACGFLGCDDLAIRDRDLPEIEVFGLRTLIGKSWRKDVDRTDNDALSEYDTVRGTQRSKVRQAIIDEASTLILVDGTVYRKCAEPVVLAVGVYFHDGAGARGRGVVLLVSPEHRAATRAQNIGNARRYTIGEFSKAIAYARRVNAPIGELAARANDENAKRRPRVAEQVDSSIAVLAYQVGRAVKPFFATMEQAKIGERSRQEIVSYCQVKDVHLVSGGTAGFDDLEAALESHVDRFRGVPETADYMPHLETALALLSERTIAVFDPGAEVLAVG